MSRPDLPPPSGPPVVPSGQPVGMPPPTGPPVIPAGSPRPDQPTHADQSTGPEPPTVPTPTGPPGPMAPPAADPADVTDGQWHRLSRRMLAVHPISTIQALIVPIAIGIFTASRQGGGLWIFIALAGALIGVAAGTMTWYVTRYRVGEEQLQLRTGLLNRKLLTAPLDRVRSVDIESPPVHRILGLAKVKVGTGVDATRIELDGLTSAQAHALRTFLLRHSEAVDHPAEISVDAEQSAVPGRTGALLGSSPVAATAASSSGAAPAPQWTEQELARIDWSWLRYAPFSLSSLVVVAGVMGVLSQVGDDLELLDVEVLQDSWAWVLAQAVVFLVGLLLIVVVIGWVLLSTASYVLNWWNLRVVRESSGNLRITRGLLTTRSQTIERAKIRGVAMSEAFLLRFVSGAELTALATGIGLGGTAKVLPPAPRTVVTAVGHDLLEEEGPLTMPLQGHGPRARRRMHVGGQLASLVVAGLVAIPTWFISWGWFDNWPWWLPLAVLGGVALFQLAAREAAWRNLGHALTEGYFVVQTGALVRSREALEIAGIIGWVMEQNFFQRRLGLADVTATTAAGSERLSAPNMPVELARELLQQASPALHEDFGGAVPRPGHSVI